VFGAAARGVNPPLLPRFNLHALSNRGKLPARMSAVLNWALASTFEDIMSYPSASPRTSPIDVIDQVGRAYRLVYDRMQLVVEMALLPYLIVLGAELVAVLMPNGVAGSILAALIHGIAFIVFASVFYVRWHRFVLLGESVSNAFIPPGWTEFLIAEIKVVGILVAGWLLLVVLASLPPTFLMVVLSSVGGVALALAALRVSLIFPAAAIGEPIGLRTAWDRVEGNFWRLFACVLAAYFPFGVAEMIVTAIGGIFPSLLWIVFEALGLALALAGMAVIATLLSQLYRDIGANNAAG
jgi:hypothetical protein